MLSLFKRKHRILFVCTENICRSPMAEGLLTHYLREMGLDGDFDVASAGTACRTGDAIAGDEVGDREVDPVQDRHAPVAGGQALDLEQRAHARVPR